LVDDLRLPNDCARAVAAAIRDARKDADASKRGVEVDEDFVVSWVEREIGIKLRSVPKVLEIFLVAVRAFVGRRLLRLAVIGPRGGGKTKLVAALELVAYRWFGYSWQNVGGSLEQAAKCYEYVNEAHQTSPELSGFTRTSHARETRSFTGGTIGINAASQHSVRGPHPVGPTGAGGLTLDEAALIDDSICDAAKGQLTSANPSALIQLSTMGEAQTGRFWELLQDPKRLGYKMMSFDIFDVVSRCQYDCATTCPAKAHFAEDYYEGEGATRRMVHSAYCGGRAHDVDGWISIDEVAQHFAEYPRSTFERELLGRATDVVGHVYDPRLIDERSLPPKWLSQNHEQHRRRFLALEKAIGIDWGFAGECAICYVLRLKDSLLVYDWEFFTRERFQVIREHVLQRCFSEKIETVLADSANPSDNEELAEMFSKHANERGVDWNPRVLPVVFSKWKAYGVGEVRRRLEQQQLYFASGFGGELVVAHERAMRYLKAYKADEYGRPIKVDDHGPDALLCACIGFATSFRSTTSFVGVR